MIKTEELIRGFSEENFSDWCRGKFADFVPKTESLPAGEFSRARQIGFVRTLADGDLNRPLLVAAVQVDGELSERSSRKRQFEYARKALKRAAESPPGIVQGVVSQGLFVFCGENGDFRMSLVAGRVEGGKPVYNSFKRQTFFVRHDEVNRTFRDQTAQEFGDFKALCEAFSIEALAKQFYKELFAWYEWALSDEMDVRYPNDIHTDKDNRDLIPEHMIRLITRLMFTWFIKQKKLVPEEIFQVEELRKLLKNFDPDSETDGNYYNAILQNLFFATLNNKIEDRAFATNGTTRAENENHYGVKTLFRNHKGGSWFKIPDDKILKLFEKVPFLNGGLFECLDRPEDEKTKRILYYDGFSREEKVKDKLTRAHVPNGLFFDKDRGLIPLFQRYNFTVEENSPNDAEVALDPELLGKVFENLLGAYNPETKETARKQSGSFYTPREIVGYMVDESLKQYLKTKTGVDDAVLAPLFEEEAKADLPAGKRKELAAAIRSVKILDPACGSGAFPMGALHRLVDLQAKLEGQPESLYYLKLHMIENCIYGVDIQTIAVQISKLRFFISLVCEQEPNGNKAKNYGILPLPNLETKFVAANTLIGLGKEMGGGLNLEDEEIGRLREELKEVRHRHFSSKSSFEKRDLRKKDKELRKNIEKRIVSIASTPNLEKIAELEAEICKLGAEKAKYAGEKWELVVEPAQGDLFGDQAANAPKNKRVDTNQAKREQLDGQIRWKQREIDAEKRKQATDDLLEEAEKLAAWNPYDQNESSPFFDPEWMFGVKSGFDVAIGNPPYGVSFSSEEKRNYAQLYRHQDYQIDSYLLFLEKAYDLLVPRGILSFIVSNTWLPSITFRKIRSYLTTSYKWHSILVIQSRMFAAIVDTNIVVFEKNQPNDSDYFDVNIFAEELKYAHRLPWSSISHTGDPINVVFSEKHFAVYQKIRAASRPLREIADVYNGVKPFEKGKGVPPQTASIMRDKPYVVEDVSKPAGKTWKPLLRGSLIHRYVCYWNHDSWIKYGEWLAAPRDPGIFEAPEKLFVRQTADSIIATYGERGCVARDNLHIILPSKAMCVGLKYILGVLNSRAMDYAYTFINPEKGEILAQVKKAHVEYLPIPDGSTNQQKRIAELVELILKAKKTDASVDTSKWEREIDAIAYKLYGLTSDEIALVEGECTAPEKVEKKPKAARPAKSKSVLVDDEGLD